MLRGREGRDTWSAGSVQIANRLISGYRRPQRQPADFGGAKANLDGLVMTFNSKF